MDGDFDDVFKTLEKAELTIVDIKPEEDPKHYSVVAHLAVSRASEEQISFLTGLSTQEVKDILALDRIKEMVRQINHRQFARDPQGHIRSLLPKALEVQEEMMGPGKKDELRLKAAESILDRSLGKAPQVMAIQTSGISLLFDKIDKIESRFRSKEIEAEHKKMDNEIEEGEIIAEAMKRTGRFQKWVDENT